MTFHQPVFIAESRNDRQFCGGGIYEGKCVEKVEERSCFSVRLISWNRQEVVENPRRGCGRVIEDEGREYDLYE